MRPQPRVQNEKAHEHSHHGHTGFTRIPRAMVLTVSFALSPVIGSFVTVIRRMKFCELECQRRGIKTTRLRRPPQPRFVKRAIGVHRIPPRVRDDREPPLVRVRRRGV